MYGAVSFRPGSLKSISVHAAFIESQNEPNSQEACGVLTDFLSIAFLIHGTFSLTRSQKSIFVLIVE